MRPLYIALWSTLSVVVVAGTSWAHGIPDLCRPDGDLETQCGAEHDCELTDGVSAEVGVCQSVIEGTMYRTCDQRRDDADCPTGQVCRIGEIDPHIGACIEPPEETEPEGHADDGHDHGHDDDGGCEISADSGSDDGLVTFIALCLCALGLRR